jgi:hypothetical protein
VVFENEKTPGSAVHLEWHGELTEALAGITRLSNTNVRISVHCQVTSLPSTEKAAEPPFEGLEEGTSVVYNEPGQSFTCSTGASGGTLTPKMVNQELPLPSKLTFSGGAGGELSCSNAGKVITTGSLKMLGFTEQEEITTKNS